MDIHNLCMSEPQSACFGSELHLPIGRVEEEIAAINIHDAILQLASPLGLGVGDLVKLSDDNIWTLLILFILAAHI